MTRKRRSGRSKWQDVADALEAEGETTPGPGAAPLAPLAAARVDLAEPELREEPIVVPPPPTPRVAVVPESVPPPNANPTEEEPRSFGAWLVRAREKRGLSIDDLAHLTKIRRAIVVSLEREARRELPEKVFIVGYVRSYAAAVGLDSEEALRRFHAAWSEDETPGAVPEGEATPPRSYGWIAPLLAAIVAAAVIWYIVTTA